MTQNKSATLELLDEWDKTTSLSCELETYSLLVADEGLTLEISCKFSQAMRSRMRQQIYVKGEESGFPLDELPITLKLVQVPSRPKSEDQNDVIGEFKYYDAIDSGDGVVNSPASIDGVIGLTASTLESMVSFLSGGIATWTIGINVLGFERTPGGDKRWDATKNSKIAVTRLALYFKDQPLPKPLIENIASDLALSRIEERLVAIEKKIDSGIKIKLF
jgi:hypothetical protein